jgi:hypothetical protein
MIAQNRFILCIFNLKIALSAHEAQAVFRN